MKHKAIIALAILLSLSISLFGQFQKKTLMAGGEINIPIQSEREDGLKHYYFNPSFGYFFLKDFVAGINSETSIYTLQGSIKTELGIGPFVRYYLGVDPVYGFIHCSFLGTWVMYNASSGSAYQSRFQPGIGIGYRLLPAVGIEAIFKFTFYHTNERNAVPEKYTSSSLNIGLQIYFPSKLN